MIHATELRLGNYIASGKEYSERSFIGKVSQINGLDAEFEQIYCECEESFEWMFKDSYCGIPITPEILEKAGFELDYSFVVPKVSIGNFYMFLHDDNILSRNFGPNGTEHLDVEIKYVHQLQNIYWCLAGRELEINL